MSDWTEQTDGVRWHVLIGTGAPADAAADAKLRAEVVSLPIGFRSALRAVSARLALDPITGRPAEPGDPERVRITRLASLADDGESIPIIAHGATVSVVARVHRPVGAVGIVRIVRVICGP
ncbi:hypothetical protein ACFWNL_18150 [Kitasatospora sp. NPDC058397]|uniref:hypothetical protein n=1 Tax=unclassified Kitasatospora TaxID=2633591 RepID=UPI003650FFCA